MKALEKQTIYEGTFDRYNPYSGLLINTETEDPVIRDPYGYLKC